MRFTAAQIAGATGGTVHGGEHTGAVGTDTRDLPEDAWFLALVGDRFDGHDFAGRAGGAGGGVFSREVAGWDRPWVEVADTTVALQDLGRGARDRLTGPVVGLTGSSGKTSTRALIACALAPMGDVHQTVGNLNNHLGVPMTLCAAPVDAPVSVVEMGTSAPGEIGFLARICRPDVRLIVNVGPAHLEELGGLEGVAREKGALFDTARPDDVLVVNLDDPHLSPRASAPGALTYGRHADADVRLVDVTLDGTAWCTRLSVAVDGEVVSAELPVLGEHFAHNATGALAVARALGVDLAEAAAALARYAPVGMRMRRETLPHGVVAFNDAYNANPASVVASLRTLASGTAPRRVAVLGDMLELGVHEERYHREVVAEASRVVDLLVLTGPRMGAAADAAAGPATVWSAEDGVTLAGRLASWLAAEDAVLFKGSRGARVERVLEAVRAALEDA